MRWLIEDIYGADLIEDPDVSYVLEGIRRKVEKEVEKADKSQAVIGLLEMISNWETNLPPKRIRYPGIVFWSSIAVVRYQL